VRVTRRWLGMGASIALFCGYGMAQETAARERVTLNSIIQTLEKSQAGIRPQVSYQVIREYRLSGASNSSTNSDVVAEVHFRPPGREDYTIQKSSGSARGQQVVQRVLDHEVEEKANGNQARSALNRDNYDFNSIGQEVLDGQPCYLLGLTPRRKEKDLISGKVWVDQRSFLVRQIEGELAKTPSWWLRKVHIKLTFADLNGTWLQTNMEAVADVRLVGLQTLTSRVLDYQGAAEVASTRTSLRSVSRKP